MRNKKKKNNNYSDILLATAKITKDVIINEDIKILNKVLLSHEETKQVRTAIAHLLNDYARQKQINEEHKKENDLLRKKIKELEEIISEAIYYVWSDENKDKQGWWTEALLNILEEKKETFYYSIPRKNIENEIEKLKQEKKQLRIDKNVTWDSQIYKLDLKIQILEELLQEEDK